MAENEMKQNRPGDSNRITREYFDSLLVEMRHIDSVLPSTKLTLYGKTFDTPVMMSALSHLKYEGKSGMAEMARGAAEAHAVNWCGMGDEKELEEITSTGAETIKIVKPYENNGYVIQRIEHAEKCGCLAVGMDLDHSFSVKGTYDVVLGQKMTGKSRDELKTFVRSTSLPFVVKGVLSEKDAEKCLEAGVKGIVISHHHGIMDYAVPPLMILPKIARVIGGEIPIFLDCGVESGMDVFKALALGASAVSIGRALMPALQEKGAAGVSEFVRDVTEQLAGVMARTCTADLGKMDASLIWKS